VQGNKLIESGEYVVILGAAGGLGLVAIQIAKALGLVVIAVTNSDKKKEACKRFGADLVLDSDDNWGDAARAFTPDNSGVDIVLDPLGMVDRSLKCIAWNGRIVVIGFAAGAIEKIAMNKVLLKNCSISGVFWGRYATEEPETVVKVWHELIVFMKLGKIRPTVYNEEKFVGLQSLPRAFSVMATGEAWGKIAITVEEDDMTSKL
jgi:NADPH:quinone reductase-like Zn-dependent oxidoreductase